MNSDLAKRERIREALAARLLQLSKQCEKICGSPSPFLEASIGAPDEKPADPENLSMQVFRLHFPDPVQNVDSREDSPEKAVCLGKTVNKIDSILPVMINNFLKPGTTLENEQVETNPCSSETKQAAFCKDVLFSKLSISESHGTNVPRDDNEVLEDAYESQGSHSDCESHLFLATPSTDLDRYMEGSSTLERNSSSSSSPSSSNESSVSDMDDVTVVSLTSDTESQVSVTPSEMSPQQPSHHNRSQGANITESLPRVLNELAVQDGNGTSEIVVTDSPDAEVTNIKTTSRRRLSYTLESPSPVLEKALRNHSVGPTDTTSTSNQISGAEIMTTITPNWNTPAEVASRETISLLNRTSSPPESKTMQASMSAEKAGKTREYYSPTSKIPVIRSARPNLSSFLHGFDQQLHKLDSKNQSLRQYLDRLNSPLPLISTKHHSNESVAAASQKSPASPAPLPLREPSLSAELKSLSAVISQQQQMLAEQMRKLQDMENFFQRLSMQQQQVTKMQTEFSQEMRELFYQHSRAVETKLHNLDVRIQGITKVRLKEIVSKEPEYELVTNKENLAQHIPSENHCLLNTDTVDQRETQRKTVSHSVSNLETQAKFDRVSAAVKGYLTRRLMKTEKVQGLIQTIKDTMECALSMHDMTRNNVTITKDDADLHQRLINQVTSACHAFHDIFFKYSVEERMHLIAQSRQLAKEKHFKDTHNHLSRPYISSATVKSLERKKFVKSKSVSPNAGRKKWKEPKRPSTVIEVYHRVPKSPPHRDTVPMRSRTRRPKQQSEGDCRSPSFYR